ncbi:hypothetical protein Tco_1335357 [Tanacetum coccineum]
MDVLELCPKQNMVAYLEKTDGNIEFHEIISFLTRSSIHYALTVSPVVSTTFVEQFWMFAKSKIINNVRYITAKVVGKPVSISEASIRSDLLFDDVDGIDSLPNQAIFDVIQLMGYEGDLTVLTFNKALFSPQWRFLFHTMNHCISSKSTSWDQIPTNIATAVICLTTNQKYNFSKLIFDGMMRHLDAKKKFVMYPRFISVFLDTQLKNVLVPLDHFPINALTSKVFSFMVKKGKHFSGNITPLFDSMMTEPSPRPSPTTHIPDSILEGFGGNHGDQAKEIIHLKAQIKKLKKKTKPVITHHKAWMKSERKPAKAEPTVHKDLAFDELDDDIMDYIETEDAQDVGRTSYVPEDSTDKPDKGTDKPKVNTDKEEVSTDRPDEGTVDQNEGRSATQTTPTTSTPTIFGDDETIAQVLIIMSQNKEKLKEKEKGVELKDVEETERPRPTSTRSLLTLKPLPNIDPKDKGKNMIEEEDESDTDLEDITEAEKKFKQLARDEEVARKVLNADKILAEKLQEEEREMYTIKQRAKFLHDTIAAQRRFLAQQRSEAIRNKPPSRNQLRNQMMTYLKHVGGKKHSDLKTKGFKEIKALYDKIKRSDDSFIAIGSTEDEKVIKEMNEQVADASKKKVKKNDSIKGEIKEEEGTRKRKLGIRKKMKSKKRKFTSKDDEELRLCLTIVSDEDKEVDYEIFDKKYPIIEWRSEFLTTNHMLSILDRDDICAIYQLVMNKYQDETLEGINTIMADEGIVIHMLEENKYPLKKEVLSQLLKLKLETEEDKNGNSWVPIPVTTPESGPSTALKMTVPSTTEEKICKKNDVKARNLLLMALPNEHQLTFNQYVDAHSMFIAIKARFGGNDATKKTQKALLKQQYKNFVIPT